VYGLVFGVAPVHIGYAAVMAVPAVERGGYWWVFYLAAAVYLWALSVDCLTAGGGDPAARRRALVLRWYVLPVLGSALLHAAAVLVTACGPEWRSLARAAAPPAAPPEIRPGETPPPPGGPPREVGPFLGAGLDLVGRAARAALVFLYRLWLGTPAWLFLLAAAAAWAVTPVQKVR
jgi:hypothetical protein